jgi:hypothetical protein
VTLTVAAFEFTATISTTETSMTTNTSGPDSEVSDGIFQAFVDLNAMAAGDVFEWKLYETTRTSGGTQRLVQSARFSHAQATPIWVSPALLLGVAWDMTLKKISGTDRSIAWRIAKSA